MISRMLLRWFTYWASKVEMRPTPSLEWFQQAICNPPIEPLEVRCSLELHDAYIGRCVSERRAINVLSLDTGENATVMYGHPAITDAAYAPNMLTLRYKTHVSHRRAPFVYRWKKVL